jgi:4-carboxymuconolactone decarboxylase
MKVQWFETKLEIDMSKSEAWKKGLSIVDEVYGPGSSSMMDGMEGSAFVQETVSHLFADIWSLPELSIRDKRLLVVGATTMLGRADLLTIQLAGAIVNGELTDAQLEEMKLLMMFYAGAGNTTALNAGIQGAKTRAAGMKKKPS